MEVKISIGKINRNIDKARQLVGCPVALMFKEFYEYVSKSVKYSGVIYGKHLQGSVCYSIGEADGRNDGAVVISLDDAMRLYWKFGMRKFFIPINANDNREGVSVERARELAHQIRLSAEDSRIVGLVTSGCMDTNAPTTGELDSIWKRLGGCVSHISIGGSYWLDKAEIIPSYVGEVRIGEYMLFGTIPFSKRYECFGENAIEFEAKVIGVYPERSQFIVDAGYSVVDIRNCCMLSHHPDARLVNASSEYAIFSTSSISGYEVGQLIRFKPDYYSMVKIKEDYVKFV